MKSKKIASMIGTAIAVVSMTLSGIPAYAAVTTMPDGGKFDAAYYAATYPDVTAGFSGSKIADLLRSIHFLPALQPVAFFYE